MKKLITYITTAEILEHYANSADSFDQISFVSTFKNKEAKVVESYRFRSIFDVIVAKAKPRSKLEKRIVEVLKQGIQADMSPLSYEYMNYILNKTKNYYKKEIYKKKQLIKDLSKNKNLLKDKKSLKEIICKARVQLNLLSSYTIYESMITLEEYLKIEHNKLEKVPALQLTCYDHTPNLENPLVPPWTFFPEVYPFAPIKPFIVSVDERKGIEVLYVSVRMTELARV